VIRIEVSSRPAHTISDSALSIRTSLRIWSRVASPWRTMQPHAFAPARLLSLVSITTMWPGSVPRAISSSTVSDPVVP